MERSSLLLAIAIPLVVVLVAVIALMAAWIVWLDTVGGGESDDN